MQGLRAWASRIKRDLVAVAGAVQDPRTPRSARVLGLCVLAYALSPIDLIPDVIPVLGLVDDIVLVPLGLMLVMRLIPKGVLAEHRELAKTDTRLPASRAGAAAIVFLWAVLLAGSGYWAWQAFAR